MDGGSLRPPSLNSKLLQNDEMKSRSRTKSKEQRAIDDERLGSEKWREDESVKIKKCRPLLVLKFNGRTGTVMSVG